MGVYLLTTVYCLLYLLAIYVQKLSSKFQMRFFI